MTANDPLTQGHALMCRMRAFEEACLKGVPTREIHGELHTGIGQEAIAAGMARHLRPGDAVVSTHRNHLHALAKGVSPRALLAEIFERETGLCRGRGGHMHPFDPDTHFSATGIVGASLPVALGHAYAAAMEGRGDIAVGITGDGGANHGTFHEVLNMAGAWRLPLIVLVENNGYGISVRADAVTAPVPHWKRAAAYAAHGIAVDGTDVAAVEAAFAEAVAHARAGKGPVVVEAAAHRFRGHYEGDADTYRPRADRKRMREEGDPIAMAEERLVAGGADPAALAAARKAAEEEMAALLEEIRQDPMPDPAGALDHVFAEGPAA